MQIKPLIARAGALLRRAAPPGSRIILFGSHSRGEERAGSDLDFLIVEPEVSDPNGEMVRLRDSLRPLRVPADVVVASFADYERWRTTPNNVIYEADREGVVLDDEVG